MKVVIIAENNGVTRIVGPFDNKDKASAWETKYANAPIQTILGTKRKYAYLIQPTE